jgi:hypothetical protein
LGWVLSASGIMLIPILVGIESLYIADNKFTRFWINN